LIMGAFKVIVSSNVYIGFYVECTSSWISKMSLMMVKSYSKCW
jgi:hypothetical protein